MQNLKTNIWNSMAPLMKQKSSFPSTCHIMFTPFWIVPMDAEIELYWQAVNPAKPLGKNAARNAVGALVTL